MSKNKNKSVQKLVEKYMREYPYLERSLLGKLIRLENPSLFNKDKNISYESNTRTLSRHLEKAYKVTRKGIGIFYLDETIEGLLAKKTPEMLYHDFEFLRDCGTCGLQKVNSPTSCTKELDEEEPCKKTKEDTKKQAEEAEQRKLDLKRIAKLKTKPQRYNPEQVKEVKEYLKNVEKLKEQIKEEACSPTSGVKEALEELETEQKIDDERLERKISRRHKRIN